MITLLIFILIFCSFGPIWTATPYEDCGSKLGTIESFSVTNCTKAPCIFVKRHNYLVNLTFQAKASSNSASISLTAIFGGIPFKIPLPDPDACKLGVRCPVKQNDTNTETMLFPLSGVGPPLLWYFKIEIKADDQNQDYACVQFSAMMTSSSVRDGNLVDWKKGKLFEALNQKKTIT